MIRRKVLRIAEGTVFRGFYAYSQLPFRKNKFGKLFTFASPTVTPINSVPMYAKSANTKAFTNPRNFPKSPAVLYALNALPCSQYLNPSLSCPGTPPRSIMSANKIKPMSVMILVKDNQNSISPNHLTPRMLTTMTNAIKIATQAALLMESFQ